MLTCMYMRLYSSDSQFKPFYMCRNSLENEVSDPFAHLKAKIKKGEGGTSLRLAFRRFKTTLATAKGGEGVNFKGFCKCLTTLGIRLSETNVRKVFDRIDENNSGTYVGSLYTLLLLYYRYAFSDNLTIIIRIPIKPLQVLSITRSSAMQYFRRTIW